RCCSSSRIVTALRSGADSSNGRMSDPHHRDSGSVRVRHCRASCLEGKPPVRSMRRAERTLMPTFAAAASCSISLRCSMYLATCVRLIRLPAMPTLPRLPKKRNFSHPADRSRRQVTGQDSCRRPAKIIVADHGRELGVHFVLQGSVQRNGTKMRINAQLADATSNAQLWSESFEGDQADLF